MSKTITITGKTYEVKDVLKAAGASWDSVTRAWTMDGEKFAALKARKPNLLRNVHASAPIAAQAAAFDAIYNEGGEGYNPHRA